MEIKNAEKALWFSLGLGAAALVVAITVLVARMFRVMWFRKFYQRRWYRWHENCMDRFTVLKKPQNTSGLEETECMKW